MYIKGKRSRILRINNKKKEYKDEKREDKESIRLAKV